MLHQDLVKTGFGKYCARDEAAHMLEFAPTSELKQQQLIRATVATADRFAAITTYKVAPTEGSKRGEISATMFAMLEALAARQGDDNFNFLFFYNENKLETIPAVASFIGRKVAPIVTFGTEKSGDREITWSQVMEAYNEQQKDPQLKLRDVRCGIYFVAAKARGLAGSHHNKFCINDRGLAATLGASIGNQSKPRVLDSGCVTVSQKLASSQWDHLFEVMLGGHSVRCGRLRTTADGKPIMERLPSASAVRRAGKVVVSNGLAAPEAAQDAFWHKLEQAGIPKSGHKQAVLWVQNQPHGFRNKLTARGKTNVTPIGAALSRMLEQAGPGDVLKIARGKVDTTGVALIERALSKGCDVKLLLNEPKRAPVEQAARKFFSERPTGSCGSLTVRNIAPSVEVARQAGIDPSLSLDGMSTHAKVYILERPGGSQIVATGTFNLDGQSLYRSGENIMVFETRDHPLGKMLFDDLFAACADAGRTTRFPNDGAQGSGRPG